MPGKEAPPPTNIEKQMPPKKVQLPPKPATPPPSPPKK